MSTESVALCNLCEDRVMLCVPGTKAECGVFLEYLDEMGKSVKPEKHESSKPRIGIANANSGIMNRLYGQIIDIDKGQIMTKVTLSIGDNFFSTIMPTEDFIQSKKKLGDTAGIAIKSFNVKLMV